MAQAILLLHGFATDADDFKNIRDELNQRYEVVVAKTLPSHLKDNHLKDFTEEEAFAFFEQQYDELIAKYEQIDIIGFSMGGALATYFASKGHIGKLILLAPANAYFNVAFPLSQMRIFFDSLLADFSTDTEEMKDYHRELMRSTFRNSQVSADMAVKKLLPNYTYHSLTTFRQIIRHCNSEIKRIKAQTLIVYGTVDQLVPKSSISMVAKYCDDCRTVILPGISHLMLNSCNFEVVRDCVIRFIDGIEENRLAM